MQRPIFVVICMLFVFACEKEDPTRNLDSEKIPGKYSGGVRWVNGNDAQDQFFVSDVSAIVSTQDDYYKLEFDPHPAFNLPQLNLEVYEINGPIHSFHILENGYFREYGTWNNFWVSILNSPPEQPTSFPTDQVLLRFKIISLDPDSLYFIYYEGGKPFQ